MGAGAEAMVSVRCEGSVLIVGASHGECLSTVEQSDRQRFSSEGRVGTKTTSFRKLDFPCCLGLVIFDLSYGANC